MLLSRVWHAAKRAYTRTIDRYADLLERRPYATQCTTSAALWFVADLADALALRTSHFSLNNLALCCAPKPGKRARTICAAGSCVVNA